MTMLHAIEARHHFRYPELYYRLCTQGLLNESSSHFLEWGEDFEALPVEDIEASIHRLYERGGMFDCAPEHRFIPFGCTGAGDYYCFQLDSRQDGAMDADWPVLLVWHDNGGFADHVSANLHDFIFKQLLGAVANPWQWNRELEDGVAAMWADHACLLKPEHQAVVSEIYARPAFEYEIPYPNKQGFALAKGRLTGDEYEALIDTHTRYALAWKRFSYARPQPVVQVTEANVRRVGTLTLTLHGYSRIREAIAPALKALNWRKNESSVDDRCILTRKNHVFLGPPLFEELDAALRLRLQAVLQHSTTMEIRFTTEGEGEWTL
ncbi:SMI1/KNR4 family protein [Ottowia thiooxydans]|uniref:SMI1/KNR4 family protein n=1 Tax=Ottowia thiooxydans TaxID=219182 RepID=UPI0012EB48F1|nr:SMI1/KNR4 family protein [Ottowia thiooxydans]